MTESRYRAVKAYENQTWIHSRDARALRILSEYMEPESRFEELGVKDTIVVFGSARLLPEDVAKERLEEAKKSNGDVAKAERDLHMSMYYEAARELSHKLTEWSKSLGEGQQRFVICSGGGPGIMEAANRGAHEAKGMNIVAALADFNLLVFLAGVEFLAPIVPAVAHCILGGAEALDEGHKLMLLSYAGVEW